MSYKDLDGEEGWSANGEYECEKCGTIQSPINNTRVELGANYNKKNVEAFLSRVGEKITSIDDEMELIRQLGIASNGAREYVSIFSRDGMILHTQEGIEPGTVSLAKEAIDMLKTAKENSIIMLHNHASNVGFSGVDIKFMCDYKSIEKIGAICHNGDKYFLAIGDGMRPLGDIAAKEYSKYITNRILPYIGEPMPLGLDKAIIQDAIKYIADKYNWQ